MYRLFSLSTLLFVLASTEPRTPKIYNVLISTKKNLSPSHAVPVFEPVLRTTSLGVALPPLFYQTPGLAGYQPLVTNNFESDGTSQSTTQGNEQQNNQDVQETLPPEQFIPYNYNPYFVNTQGYYPQVQGQPSIQQPQQVQSTEQAPYLLHQVDSQQQRPQQLPQQLLQQQPQRLFQEQQQQPRQLLQPQPPQHLLQQQPPRQYVEDPKTIVANLKRNPNIPDVPPPAIPVRTIS